MQIELASLESKKGQFAHVYKPGELSLNDERVGLVGPPRVSGSLQHKGQKLEVQGQIQARVQLECDRCLQLIELPIGTDFKLEYVTAEEYESLQGAELGEQDLLLSVFDGETVDIDEIVREQLLLAAPSRLICQDNCKGLCPNCNANWNEVDCDCEQSDIDPRWAALKELVNRES